MGYQITHALANGLTAYLAIARPGEYAIYAPGRRFIAYAKNLKAAKEFAKNYVVEVNSGL